MNTRLLVGFLACLPAVFADRCQAAGPSKSADEIKIESVLVTLIDQVDVPAQESGVLSGVAVHEGQLVADGDVLAQVDDTEAALAHGKAQLEFEIAHTQAQNDVDVRFARKSAEVAKAELRRAKEALEKYKKSISQSEMDKLTLEVERATLAIEQAEKNRQVALLTQNLKDNEVQATRHRMERRKIVAPLAAVVVQVKHKRGEWVEPGETVVRLLRIDSLRVEGFLALTQTGADLNGAPVTLRANVPGHGPSEFPGSIVFVSPEVDPVNGQVRIWAEVENPDRLLKPGIHGTLTIRKPVVEKNAASE